MKDCLPTMKIKVKIFGYDFLSLVFSFCATALAVYGRAGKRKRQATPIRV
jgi:hypothetical protein